MPSSPPPTEDRNAEPPQGGDPASEQAAGATAGDDSLASPAWAQDLRQLYDAVVEEPLPDSILDLLSQLDAED